MSTAGWDALGLVSGLILIMVTALTMAECHDQAKHKRALECHRDGISVEECGK